MRLAIFALLALLAAWPLLATGPALNEFRDAHILAHYEQAAADAVLRYGQAPLWDPCYCGGMYLLGTPQSRFASPTFALTLLFGEGRASALIAFGMMIVGLEGAYRYARSRSASKLGALLGAPVFGLSGVFAIAPWLGWINFYGFALLPWMALGVRTAARGARSGVVLAAVSVAWCVGFGGTYAVPLAALWCAFEIAEVFVLRARTPRRLIAPLAMTSITLVLALGLSAVRLWPVLESMRDAPRVIGGQPGTSYAGLGRMLFRGLAPHTEDGSYFIGAWALVAIAIGCTRRRSIPLLFYGAVWGWLAAGYAVHPSLFELLRKLPMYGVLRYPERFLILFALVASTLAARGVTIAEAFARSRPVRARRGFAVAGVVASLALVAGIVPAIRAHVDAAARRELVAPPERVDRPFHQARGTRWALAYYEPMQRGSLSCFDAYPVPQSPLLRGDLAAEEYLEDPSAGVLHERSWSPNRIELDVDLARPARIAVNQNWHRGWRASVGDVTSERGLLVVDVPAGKHAVSIGFAPRSAIGGALVSAAALVGLVLVARIRGRRALVVAAALPFAAFAAALLLVRERPPPPRELFAPSGEPVVADATTAGAQSIGASLGGVVLEAARISASRPRAGDPITLELDWKRTAKIEHGLGVFVHLESSAGDTVNGDHALLSSAVTLDDAPAGKTLRDLVSLTLPDDAAGKRWTAWVGLWRASGDGTRVAVLEPGAATVDDNRIRVIDIEVR